MMSRSLSALGACLVLAAALLSALSAQPAGVEPRADTVLRSMTGYLSALKKFSVTAENTLEVVTSEGQKIQYTAPATMTVARPNKLRAHRVGVYADVTLIFDGKTVSILGKHLNGYAQFEAPGSVDHLIEALRGGLAVRRSAADELV